MSNHLQNRTLFMRRSRLPWPRLPWPRLLLLFAFAVGTLPGGNAGSLWAAPGLQAAGLGPTELANATYFLGEESDTAIELSDGTFQDEQRTVFLVPEWTIYGDFLGDGIDDAVVVLAIAEADAETGAETDPQLGVTYALAILIEEAGAPLNLVTLPLGAGLQVQDLRMVGGEIAVDLAASDATVVGFHSTQIFVLEGEQILQFDIPGLTLDILGNLTYPPLSVSEDAITLVDGQYSDEADTIGIGIGDVPVFGDLDGDMVPDAAVILVSSGGGTGVFFDLAAVRNADGEAIAVDTVFLGDRVGIEGMFIREGTIVLDLIEHGPEDPMCCPTESVRRGFVLEGDSLVEIEIEQVIRLISGAFGPLLPLSQPGSGYGFVNLAGEWIIEPQFGIAFPFAEGMAAVALDDGNGSERFGYIDTTGNVVIAPQFMSAGDFHQGIAVVELDAAAAPDAERWVYIDRSGQVLFDGAAFAEANPFSEGLAAVRTERSVLGTEFYSYIDRQGTLVIDPESAGFDTAGPFSGGLALISRNGQYGFAHRSGRIAILTQFSQGGTFAEGLAPVEIFGEYGYINSLGDLVIRPQFESAGPFSEGAALVTLDGRLLYIDPQGNVLTPELAISRGRNFHEGLAAVTVEGRVGYINSTGEFIIEPQFLEGGDFENGMAVVYVETGLGVIDPTGTWLLQLPIP